MDGTTITGSPAVSYGRFEHPDITAKGETRASVALRGLRTLWFNTGTLCNLACVNCYIESSPSNDRLTYLTLADVTGFLDEIRNDGLPTEEIGFTGGEPFMNPQFMAILEETLGRGFSVIVLTNAMKPMTKVRAALKDLRDRHGDLLTVRVSVDHYTEDEHARERGDRSWASTLDGLRWLLDNGFRTHVAGRSLTGEDETTMRRGFAGLFRDLELSLDADDPEALVLFPEMDEDAPVPEVTTACWGTLGVSPDAMMCASSRMVVRRKGAEAASVVACTLLPYDEAFDMGGSLRAASGTVKLNHPHCAKFCVLGGGSCSKS